MQIAKTAPGKIIVGSIAVLAVIYVMNGKDEVATAQFAHSTGEAVTVGASAFVSVFDNIAGWWETGQIGGDKVDSVDGDISQLPERG